MSIERHMMEMTELVAGLAPNDLHKPFLESQMQRANDYVANATGFLSKEIGLSHRQSEVLGLMAVGAVNKEIAGELGISEKVVKSHCSAIFEKLGVKSRVGAVLKAVRFGILNLDEISKEFDLERINSLSPRMLDILRTIVEGAEGDRELALKFGCGAQTIKNHKSSIFERLSVESTVQATLFYLAADRAEKIGISASPEKKSEELSKKEREILKRIALGLTNKEIATELGIEEYTVKNHCTRIFGKLGVESRLNAVLVGISQGVIDLGEASVNFDLDFISLLTPQEKEVLAQVIPAGGKHEKISEALEISPHTVKNHLRSIYRKIGVLDRVQAALFYLAAQKSGLMPNPQAPQETVV